MVVLLEAFVVVLAAASVTRLVAFDDITHRLRVWLTWRITRDPQKTARPSWCRWCAGWWVGLALAWVWWLLSDTPHLFGEALADVGLVALALRYTTGWLADRERT